MQKGTQTKAVTMAMKQSSESIKNRSNYLLLTGSMGKYTRTSRNWFPFTSDLLGLLAFLCAFSLSFLTFPSKTFLA